MLKLNFIPDLTHQEKSLFDFLDGNIDKEKYKKARVLFGKDVINFLYGKAVLEINPLIK